MPTAETLTTKALRAAQWRTAGVAVAAGSQLLVGVVLARLLSPADFGVAALAYIVLGFAQPLGDAGLGGAVIQRSGLTDRHIRAAFTCSMIVGVSVAAIVALAAPFGAIVLRDARAAPVLRVLSIGIALRGTAVVADALLRRQLDFRRQVAIDTASYVVGYGLVAVTLAWSGQGVWSLVWGGLVQTLIASVEQLAVVRHPMRPLLAVHELQELFVYGLAAAVSGCVNYVALNGDYFVVGRLMGALNLGLYSRAYALMNLPQTYAAGVISGVMFPAFAQVQDEPARVRSGYLLVTKLTAMIAAPAMAILAVAAPPIVRGLYGSQWVGAIVPLQILAIAGYFRALYHLGGIVAQSVGRVYGELWRQITYATAVVVGALVASRYGLPGVAAGVSAAILYMFVATGHLALQATGTAWRAYARVQIGALVTAVITGAVALFVRVIFEAASAPSAIVAIAVLAAAGVPWCAGVLWTLSEAEFEPLRRSLPLLAKKPNRLDAAIERIDTRTAAVPGTLRLFSKCRNERLRLPAFLDHYRRLGVETFFLVDNDSSDG